MPVNKYAVLVDEWTNDMGQFNQDLEWILQLEYHKFWSQVIHDPSVIQAVSSFLQEAVPCYTPLPTFTTNEKVLNLYGKILKNTVTIICRLVTAKESEQDWMSKEFLGDFLYTNYLISVPMMFDLVIALGGGQNLGLLSKILTELFKIQPNYLNDLRNGLEYIQQSFNTVTEQVQSLEQQEINEAAIETSGLENLALYSLDCAVTLHLTLEAYSEARDIADELGICFSISSFYDIGIPLMYKLICENQGDLNALRHLNNARLELINTFHGILNVYLEGLLARDRSQTGAVAEKILSILEESLDHQIFAIDYQKLFPAENDLDIIRQGCDDINLLRLDYIQAGYIGAHKSREPEQNGVSCVDEVEEEEEAVGGTGMHDSSKLAPVTLDDDAKIKQILDVFPDYGDGYVRKLLKRYDMNPEQVITAVLEGNLPPDLSNADKSEVYIPPERSEFFVETGIERLNIYDGDEFDILSNANVKNIYKKGVSDKKEFKDIFNDKSHIEENKERYERLGLVEENDEYDDEYDDSYDALADSEAKKVRIIGAANVLVDELDNSEDEEEVVPNTSTASRDKSKDFCENPEEIRARYEQRRQLKYGNRDKPKDVAGKPKGQGQDEKTKHDRRKKDENKASSANHNRKKAATWKQSRGMY